MKHFFAFILTVVTVFLVQYFVPDTMFSSAGNVSGSLFWTFLTLPVLLVGLTLPYLLADLAWYLRGWPRWSPLVSVGPVYFVLVLVLFLLAPPREADSWWVSTLIVVTHSLLFWAYSLVYGIPLVAIAYLKRRPEPPPSADVGSAGRETHAG